MMGADVHLEIDGPVASIVLARPETRNAMTLAMGIEIERAVGALNERSDVRAVLVRGEGKAFCAGGDLGFIEARTRETPSLRRLEMLRFYRLFLSIRALSAPSIAVIHGAARGAGVCFALACDARLGGAGATLALNFVRIGLHPGMGATHFLPRIIGPARATELLLTGRTVAADEALRLGLLNAVHPEAELLAAARRMAEDIAAAAPLAVRQTKRSLTEGFEPALEQALDAEARAQAVDYGSLDVAEGVLAFRERRAPRFLGR
jgi:enoyl-CoA hydratase/carnithine racemase